MTRIEVMDLKISAAERYLARVQSDGMRTRVNAKLALEQLEHTMSVARVMAEVVQEALALPFDEHLEDMARDMVDPISRNGD